MGNEDWVKKFSFNVFAADNITTDYDMSQRNPFLRCPVQVIEGQISTFPRGILEVTMWLEGEKLHFKSYNEAALRSSVRSQVFIPMEDLELMNQSYLDQSVGRIKKRKSPHVEPEVNQPTKKQ